MNIEIERETDGRWIAEVPDLPGVMSYGKSREEAITKVEALALRVLADRLDHGEEIPEINNVFAIPASEQPKIELLKKELENKELFIKKMTAMTEMKTIGNAVESYITDNYTAPQATTMEELRQQLEPLYIKELPLNDPWGKPYQYRPSPTDESEYTITCTGNENKIVYANGNFIDNH